ncbi:DUF802 domain-containing protein [Acidovorax radicis]|uniref:DUF802 domain-containing protein n=1 Tax=Acidovorax radicis TaxID=758826 RepID=UPI001CF94287|nr:DUF802 domain-containing protein [Acidovorax radicis]UCU99996.1 DUF802 domain-containing protein [Acidovorax radicis]
MNRSLMAAIFGAGLAVILWVGWGFWGTSPLALTMTFVMGGVYVVGAYELLRFRAATASLIAALPVGTSGPVADLEEWLARLHPALRHPVRQRIEGERVALPGPTLTPYLVGLLVMLGMLGTFLGMVVTFNGAVFALESSSSLESIRAALAAPIKGLGLSFGTSVAGVAGSAMLGLLSALGRSERLQAVRLLDAAIPTAFRSFSSAHRRDEMFHALQAQAQAMPLIAERLQGLAEGLELRNKQLGEQMLAQQQAFHRDTSSAYTDLASAVGTSLQDSLHHSARQAGETIRPVVEQAMLALAQESQSAHERLRDATNVQMHALSSQWETMAHQVADTWATALQRHTQAQDTLLVKIDDTLQSVMQTLEQRSAALLVSLQETVAQSHTTQLAADQQRLQGWSQSMQETASALCTQWERVGAQAAQQQRGVGVALEDAATRITQGISEQMAQVLGSAARWTEQTDALMRARMQAETQWEQAQGQRMDALAGVWRTELSALRDAEATRGQAAIERLDALQGAVATHLATLGAALEEPLTRMLQTASEVPQAAAGVITQLRQEMAQLSERDNAALSERTAITEQMGTLLHSVNTATLQQRAAIESLVASAASVLEQAGQQFAHLLDAQTTQMDGVAAHVSASAVELASLGESFSHGVALFSASNHKLVEGLSGVENTLSQAMARSDEQLAYYVAQAREVIDLSISSQRGIVEDLQRLHERAGARPQEISA